MLITFSKNAFSYSYELPEQGMRAIGPGKKLGVELHTQHKGMIRYLDNLYQAAVGG